MFPEYNVVLTDCHTLLHFYDFPVMWDTKLHTHLTQSAQLWCILNAMFVDTRLFHSIQNCIAQFHMKTCIRPVIKYVQQSFGKIADIAVPNVYR